MSILVFFVLLALVAAPSTALAQYMDPGASSLVVQLVIAGLVGFGTVLRIYWRKLASIFRRRDPS